MQADGYTFRVEYEDVETTNERSQRGEFDVVKISYANCRACVDRYDLLPCGGALGRGVGPLLLAHGGEWDPDAEMLVPGEFTTANFLLDFWARRPLRKRFLPFDALYAELLPDARRAGRRHPREAVHLRARRPDADSRPGDLLGAARPATPSRSAPSSPARACRRMPLVTAIRDSLHWAYVHDSQAFDLCRQYAQDLDPRVVRSHIELYVNEYSDDLGPDGEAAVAFFLAQQRP